MNSRIQGSASDLVKTAMTRIQSRLSHLYPSTLNPVDWKYRNKSMTPHIHSISPLPFPVITSNHEEAIYFPILNLHDELIYEVRKTFVPQIALEIKKEMESCLKLKVMIPVVVKTGMTWSSLAPYNFDIPGNGIQGKPT